MKFVRLFFRGVYIVLGVYLGFCGVSAFFSLDSFYFFGSFGSFGYEGRDTRAAIAFVVAGIALLFLGVSDD